MAHDILLEVGTNEVEFLEFYLGEQSFAVNVAKVKQLIRFDENDITRIPGGYRSVIGTLLHQGRNLPVVDLNLHLKRPKIESSGPRIIVITDFNGATTGFLVDGVNKIHRHSWEDLQPVSKALVHQNPRFIGVIVQSDRQVLVLDFEFILDDINPRVVFKEMSSDINRELGRKSEDEVEIEEEEIASQLAASFNKLPADSSSVSKESEPPIRRAHGAPPKFDSPLSRKRYQRSRAHVLMADDSMLFRNCLMENLQAAGYLQVKAFQDGEALLNAFKALRHEAQEENKSLSEMIHLILTDIEMPRVDGLTLCRRIKDLEPRIPVLILSSLITEQMALKCESVDADANLSKKDLDKLLESMDRFCGIEP